MRRRLFTFAAAISLLLAIATIIAWVRGYFAADEVDHILTSQSDSSEKIAIWGCGNSRGQFGVEHFVEIWESSNTKLDRPDTGHWLFRHSPPAAFHQNVKHHHTLLGFSCVWYSSPDTIERGVIVPEWALLLIFLVSPALWLRRQQRLRLVARRSQRNQCISCGYDLRASSGRCPECGLDMPLAAASKG